MKYNRGDVLEWKLAGRHRTYQIVSLISTSFGPRYKLKVLTSYRSDQVGDEREVSAIQVDANKHTTRIGHIVMPSPLGASVPAAEHSVAARMGYDISTRWKAPNVDTEKFAVKMSMQHKCHCDTFQVVHFGCKCGGC